MMNARLMMDDSILPTFPQLYPSLEDHKWTLIYMSPALTEHEPALHSPSIGRIYLIAPGQTPPSPFVHSADMVNGICCQFYPYSQWISYLQQLRTSESGQPLLISDPNLCHQIQYVLHRLMENGERPDHHGYQQLAFHYLSEIFLLLMMHIEPTHSPLDPRIHEIQQYLNQHYTESIRIEELAQLVCLSASRLSHLYKEQTGETIMDTVLRLRLEQAQHLLCSTSCYVGEIAYEVGFNSQTYFTCKFTNYFGVSPSVYRMQNTISLNA